MNSPDFKSRAKQTKKFLRAMRTQKSLFLEEETEIQNKPKDWIQIDDSIFETTKTTIDKTSNFEKDVLLKKKKKPFKGIGSRLFSFDPILAERINRKRVLGRFDISIKKLSQLVNASPNMRLKPLDFYQEKKSSPHSFSKTAYLRSLNFDFRNPIKSFQKC